MSQVTRTKAGLYFGHSCEPESQPHRIKPETQKNEGDQMKHKTIRKSGIALLVLAMILAINANTFAHGVMAPVVAPDAGQNNLPRTQFSLASLNGRYSF